MLCTWKTPSAWKPCVLCSHIAFLCVRLELKNRDCDGVMLMVDIVMHWEILLVAVTDERPTTIAIKCLWGSRWQPSYKHKRCSIAQLVSPALLCRAPTSAQECHLLEHPAPVQSAP